MKELSRASIDLSKHIFQVHGSDSRGKVIFRKRVRRGELLRVMSELPKCEVGLEACGGAHYWSRALRDMGHTVRLLAPQYVKPYVKRNKNDAADADAILEAMSRPEMRFVAVKTEQQQELCQLHRARELLVKHRTALVNEIKGFMHEYGVVLSSKGAGKLRKEYLELQDSSRLGDSTKRLMERLFEQLTGVQQEIEKHESELKILHEQNETSCRLMSIPGVGILTATAFVGAVGDGGQYKNGREFAASLGLVPRQHSSGEKERLGGISKRGDSYLRKLLVQGGHTVVMHAKKHQDSRNRWVQRLRERRGVPKAAVAVANKNARVIWALMVRGESYRANHGVKQELSAA